MKKLLPFLASLVVLLMPTSLHAAEVAGKIGYMSGAMVAQRADGTIKIMVPKSDVLVGDTLVTAKDSYAQVVMNDGTKMTLRPYSNLKIETYQFKKETPQADSAVFRLAKGGFRTVTGLIGKRGNPEAYKLRAATATIGIRGTDFTSRLCATKNCADDGEVAKPVKPPVEQAKAVGRVMLIQGEMVAVEVGGKIRKLGLGSPVFEGDTLKSSVQSHGVITFRDGGRITLQESSVFQVEKFKYEKATSQESASLKLLKGGVRVVTGLIGRVSHDNYKFGMSGATIGIRGTGFDAWCNGPCAEGAADFGATQGKPLEGAGVFVWSGEVVLNSTTGSINVAMNQAAIIGRDSGKPVAVQVVPSAIKDNPLPKPDSVPANTDKLFEESSSGGEPGLYVTVHDGQVILAQGETKVDLGKGESGFTDAHVLTRLSSTPGFMGGDKKIDHIEKHGSDSDKPNLSGGGACVVGQ